MEQLHKASNIEIHYNPQSATLYCVWKGFQSEEALKAAGNIIPEFLKQTGSTKVLNNNTEVLGPWYHSVEWAANQWFPKMIASGLRHFASVCSKDIFAQLSEKRAMQGQRVVKVLNSVSEAEEWLSRQL